ncbi:glycoside hydrolase family 16 protein [Nguyenibacter sp. L1]|uniref:glycoside hydrolase family 16 protein n=1 Tax=Nguyenibacter sp. L1 TaxID=3049350 RepID=UPI002B496D4A|nr:glycoside hydrolase family 16 protein [Nguyenibacter sp. L1]WRH87458.1 glycoside hydrolase family 16 protein [Nguyenibacter sp. L1]
MTGKQPGTIAWIVCAALYCAGLSCPGLASPAWAAGAGGAPAPALCGQQPVFDDEFDTLSLAAWRLDGRRWITHTPWAGDFGDARFTDPGPGSAFSVHGGVLSITARRDAAGAWTSGLIASADGVGGGFATMYGYFETRTKLPPGPGTWPGIWLNESTPKDWPLQTVEIDMMEYYGQFPGKYHATIHVWHGRTAARDGGWGTVITAPGDPGTLVARFHTYGVLVAPAQTIFYLDRREVWRSPTPPEHKRPLMFLINLALGGGWPINRTPNPTTMQVDYARVYRPDDSAAFARCLAGTAE